MSNPRVSILFMILAISVILLSCSESTGPNPRSFVGDEYKVALLNPGPISDAGWNASAYEGLKLIEEELDAEASQKESRTASEWKRDLRAYARDGYDLVIGHGFEFSSPIEEIALDYPDTVFVSTGGDAYGLNYTYMDFQMEDATYLVGMLAGALTKSDKVGLIVGQEIPPVRRSNASFIHGLKKTNPDAEYRVLVIGNWEDAGKAKEQAISLIDQGYDMLYQNADKAGQGVFQAAMEAEGVYAFGSNRNQNDAAPEVIIASAVSDIPEGFLQVARSVKEGSFSSQPLKLGADEGVVYMAINERHKDRITAPVMDQIREAQKKLESGAMDVNDLGPID